jgi:hypothetical protein
MQEHCPQQIKKMGKRDRLALIRAMEHVQVGYKYEPRCRDYLLISSGTQWHREIHQENKNVGSKQSGFALKVI